MAQQKKRLTQREKAERARIKKQLQEEGLLPPDKPRLNRRKFAAEVITEFQSMDVFVADYYLRQAIFYMVSADMREVTAEQVGVLKALKLAIETKRFMERLKAEGRETYTYGELIDEVILPVINL